MSFDQDEFDFDASSGDVGYLRWREQLDDARRAFEHRFGVILGRLVRVRLEGHMRSIEDTIRLVSQQRSAKHQDIRLRIKNLEFTTRRD